MLPGVPDIVREVKVEAQGVTGPECQRLTAGIEKALGEVKADQRKPEYFATAQQQQGVQQGAG